MLFSNSSNDINESSLFGANNSIDPRVASLFAKSSGPVKSTVKKNNAQDHGKAAVDDSNIGEDGSPDVSSKNESDKGTLEDFPRDSSEESSELSFDNTEEKPSGVETDQLNGDPERTEESQSQAETSQRRAIKRKRKRDDENLEALYLERLAREEELEAARKYSKPSVKKQKLQGGDQQATPAEDDELGSEHSERDESDSVSEASGSSVNSSNEDEESNDLDSVPPKHETLVSTNGATPGTDKTSRTVFLSNVSTETITSKPAKKTLLQHLSSFLPSLDPSSSNKDDDTHKVESLRFRSTPFAPTLPKKVSYILQDLNSSTSKSTHAYVVYSSTTAALKAPQALNGTVVLGRHLRVDSLAKPSKIDHRRCVFVGNLGFVDDASSMSQPAHNTNEKSDDFETARNERKEAKQKAKSAQGDVEEGLWTHFSNCGKVESVRVVRDAKTRVGKGFAYVQFYDQNGVEEALLMDGKKFPPMLPRVLRVVRAKRAKNPAQAEAGDTRTEDGKKNTNKKPNLGNEIRKDRTSFKAKRRDTRKGADGNNRIKPPESFVFEGQRATSKQGNQGLKFNKSRGGKKGGKPKTRSAKRAATWKAKQKKS